MSPSPIDDETSLEELRSVVGWFKDAKVEKKDAAGDILRCVDDDRFTKWTPFLEQMNLHKEVLPWYSRHDRKEVANKPRVTAMLFCEYWEQ